MDRNGGESLVVLSRTSQGPFCRAPQCVDTLSLCLILKITSRVSSRNHQPLRPRHVALGTQIPLGLGGWGRWTRNSAELRAVTEAVQGELGLASLSCSATRKKPAGQKLRAWGHLSLEPEILLRKWRNQMSSAPNDRQVAI